MSKQRYVYPSGESYTTFNPTTGVTSQHGKSAAHNGITLRDHFAGLAMQGMVATSNNMNTVAQSAYDIADAMLKAREVGDE